MPPPRDSITVDDGRRLTYEEHGDPHGDPIFYCHGSPGSRIEGRLFHQAAADHGFRLIAADRPGMGGSDPHPERTLRHHAADAAALADRLGITRFGLLGWSGGGAHALTTAHELPERVRCCVICASYTNLAELPEAATHLHNRADRWAAHAATTHPQRFDLAFRASSFMVKASPRLAARATIGQLDHADRSILSKPAARRQLEANLREAFTQGHRGPARDAAIQCLDWGYPIDNVAAPIDIFHGTADRLVPFAFAEHLASQLPDATLHRLDARGHFFPLTHQPAIFATARQRWLRSTPK